MSKKEHHQVDNLNSSVNTSRRRLTSAVLAGPVVLSSLASKKALADGMAYHCTVSGQISNTASPRTGDSVVCNTLGASPGCWRSPHVSNKGNGADGAHNWPAPYYPDMKFNDSNAFGVAPPCGTATITLYEMLNTSGQFTCKNMFARAAVASLLNAKAFRGNGNNPGDYPLTVDQVKDLYRIGMGLAPSKPFNQLFPGVNPSVAWNQSDIMAYFESLYGQTDACPAGKNL